MEGDAAYGGKKEERELITGETQIKRGIWAERNMKRRQRSRSRVSGDDKLTKNESELWQQKTRLVTLTQTRDAVTCLAIILHILLAWHHSFQWGQHQREQQQGRPKRKGRWRVNKRRRGGLRGLKVFYFHHAHPLEREWKVWARASVCLYEIDLCDAWQKCKNTKHWEPRKHPLHTAR